MTETTKPTMDAAQLAHLGFIQNSIARMANNAFALKALVVTITAAGLGLYVTETAPESWTAVFGVIPVTALWFLDAGYLILEKRFRALYDAVVDGTETRSMYMNPNVYKHKDGGFWTALWSWSVLWLHLIAAGTFIGLAVSDYIIGWLNG